MKKALITLSILCYYSSFIAQTTDSIIQQIQRDYEAILEIKSLNREMLLVHFDYGPLSLMKNSRYGHASASLDFTPCNGGEPLTNLVRMHFDEHSQLVCLTKKYSNDEGEGGGTEEIKSYYFKERRLIFAYEQEFIYYPTPMAGNFDGLRQRKIENRYYYHQGKLVKHLYKEIPILYKDYSGKDHAEYLASRSANTPSKEEPISENKHFQSIRSIKTTTDMFDKEWHLYLDIQW